MLEAAANCVHGQTKMVDELLVWTSDTLTVLTTNFNVPLTDDLKVADAKLKQHVVSIASTHAHAHMRTHARTHTWFRLFFAHIVRLSDKTNKHANELAHGIAV